MHYNNDDIWSLKQLKKQKSVHNRDLEQTRVSDNGIEEKENSFKLKENQQCNCQQKMMSLKKECLLQIRQLKAEHQDEIEQLENKHKEEIEQLKQKYQEEIEGLQEDLDTTNICNGATFGSEQQLIEQFENEQRKDREIFKQQLEHYISLTISLEQQLDQSRKELQSLKDGQSISQQQKNGLPPLQHSIHKNCATQLYRDTNRKIRVNTEIDRSTLYEDSDIKNGFCNSIKNFNANVKLLEKSIKNI